MKCSILLPFSPGSCLCSCASNQARRKLFPPCHGHVRDRDTCHRVTVSYVTVKKEASLAATAVVVTCIVNQLGQHHAPTQTPKEIDRYREHKHRGTYPH